MNLFVAKLSPETTQEDLQQLFETFGVVNTAKVIMDRAFHDFSIDIV